MKKTLLIFTSCLLMSAAAMAQAPELFNYQGVAHDASGPLENQAIGIKISIIENTANGNILYSERQVDTTNKFGLYSVAIGAGSPLNSTSWGNVDWTTGEKYINVAIDPNGGNTYADLGTTQLLSVPYALFAGSTPSRDTALGKAGGDLTGNYPNPTIGNNTINSNNITNNAISSSKIANNAITANKLYQMGANTGDILKWNGTIWEVAADSSKWSLNGNNINSTAFIGTLNDEDIRFKRDGNDIGRIESNNIAFGSGALNSSSTGSYNYAIGDSALYSNSSGSTNIALGSTALKHNTSGRKNNAIGVEALLNNTTGYSNSALGTAALIHHTTGNGNVGLGFAAGYNDTTGSFLTMVGYFADVERDNYNKSGSFGYYSTITASNQYRIGSPSSTLSIGGRVGWTTTSDGRFKTNVKENVAGLEFIQQLRPITYTLDNKKIEEFIGIDRKHDEEETPQESTDQSSEIFSGFIAQEVEATAKKLGYDFHGVDEPKNDKDYYGLRYAEFVVPLVKAVQEQQEIIDAQNERIEKLESLVEQLLDQEK